MLTPTLFFFFSSFEFVLLSLSGFILPLSPTPLLLLCHLLVIFLSLSSPPSLSLSLSVDLLIEFHTLHSGDCLGHGFV